MGGLTFFRSKPRKVHPRKRAPSPESMNHVAWAACLNVYSYSRDWYQFTGLAVRASHVLIQNLNTSARLVCGSKGHSSLSTSYQRPLKLEGLLNRSPAFARPKRALRKSKPAASFFTVGEFGCHTRAAFYIFRNQKILCSVLGRLKHAGNNAHVDPYPYILRRSVPKTLSVLLIL